MAPPISMLSTLTPQTDSSSLLVRLARIWESINKRTNQVMYTNLIFVDEEGNHMLATVRNNQKDMYLPLLSEQNVYTISNVKVVPGPASYRTVDRDLALNFYYKTKVQKVADTGVIPRFRFELKEFKDVPNLVGDVRCFIDVIGIVIGYGQLDTRANGARKMDVILDNASDDKLVVALWEEKAKQFQDLLATTRDVLVFVVITGLLAKKFSDKVILSSTDATSSFFNIDYAPLNDLRTSITIANGGKTDDLPKPTATQFITLVENCLETVTIREILEARLPSGTTVLRRACEAEIVEVLEGDGWYYNCCPRCTLKVQPLDGNYYCSSCAKEANDFKPRFRLIIRVEDASGRTSFTLFNKEAEQIIGAPVEKVLDGIQQASNPPATPPIIRNIIRKRCAFDVKINSYNIDRGYEEYTVSRISECAPTSRGIEAPHTGSNDRKKQKIQ